MLANVCDFFVLASLLARDPKASHLVVAKYALVEEVVIINQSANAVVLIVLVDLPVVDGLGVSFDSHELALGVGEGGVPGQKDLAEGGLGRLLITEKEVHVPHLLFYLFLQLVSLSQVLLLLENTLQALDGRTVQNEVEVLQSLQFLILGILLHSYLLVDFLNSELGDF